jgi:SAM-dependent methyltransferase
MAQREFALLMRLLQPVRGATLLDAGTGTGHFARRFADAGLRVTGLDPDGDALAYAQTLGGDIEYVRGDARALPWPDASFDYCAAITSLCFVPEPQRAVAEMWRVCRRGMVLGLLNRRSLLHREKAGRGGYRGARWDDTRDVRRWVRSLPRLHSVRIRTALFLPSARPVARAVEPLVPGVLPWGGFLAVYLRRET